MRAESRRTLPRSGAAVVAITTTARINPTMLEQRFQTAGYEVVQQPRISRTRSDRAVVLNAYSPGATAAASTQKQGPFGQPAVTWAEFQPVWSVPSWCCTGLELYVVDDGDACRQLDVLARGVGCARDDLTIKPRVGWQGYGHPDVQELG
jgi:hypothetical protein